MKKSILGLVAIGALVTGPAMAADLRMPVKAAPVPMAAPVYSWTGLYLGINGGGGWGNESWTDNSCAGACAVTHHPSGGIFGGHIGYRYQINNNFVFGVEGMAAWADLEDTVSTASAIFPTETENFKVRALYSATGQVGFAFSQALLYVKGGWAGANTRATLSAPTVNAAAIPPGFIAAPFTASNTQDNSGWTIGVGLDYALVNNFVVGVEYDHYDLGYGAFTAPASSGPAFAPWVVTNPSRLTIDSVVGRLSYKFNFGGGPVAARY